LLFRGGEIIRKVPQEALEAVLIEEVENLVARRQAERVGTARHAVPLQVQ